MTRPTAWRLRVARGVSPLSRTTRRAPSPRPRSSTPAPAAESFIKIPGTREGLPAIEEAIFAGVPINVTLLFSREHYVAAADAYMRGIERRIAAGLNPDVRSVASVFISRWDRAVAAKVPAELHAQLGIAIAKRTYHAYRNLLDSDRAQRLANNGARPQRLLWASTGTKDPRIRHPLLSALSPPAHREPRCRRARSPPSQARRDRRAAHAGRGHAEDVLARFGRAGVDVLGLAADLQTEGAKAFVTSWNE